MNIAKKLSVLTVIFSMLFLVSCGDDNDDPATSGTLNVTINVTNPEAWPPNGTVFCSMDSVWPPQGAPYKSTTLLSSQVQNGVISLVFEDIEFNTYKLLSVSWRDPDNPDPTTNQYIWGAHSGSMFENGQFVFYANATPFTMDQNNSELSLVVNATITTGGAP
tara:strand:- start:221 stop:709 length:489 start_codon:yes stop_codon:yes gene_type:complete